MSKTVWATACVVVTLITSAIANASAAGNGGSKLAPIGATQPARGAVLPACDENALAPTRGREGACQSRNVTIVAVNRRHAVKLRPLTLDVADVAPIGRITIGSGSIGPLDPNANAWVAVTMHVKNTSGQAVAVRDEQLELRLGATNYQTQPEATSEVPDSLTTPSRKIGNGTTIRGRVVFEVPSSAVGTLTTFPATLRFTGFGGDFSFNEFPGGAVGAVRLYS